MGSLDVENALAKHPMIPGCMRSLHAGLLALFLLACRDNGSSGEDSARGSLPPVFPSRPTSSTNWDAEAGPLMLLSIGANSDSAAVVLPEVSDSTIASLQTDSVPVAGLVFDLFGRGGKISGSTKVGPVKRPDAIQDCDGWPVVGVRAVSPGWRVGFTGAHVQGIKLDSIEAMPSTDSAALAVSIAETAATLAIASDPAFRGLPFRVRSAYTFRLDTVDVVIADVVRSVNEEANPRIEHLLMIGERPAGSTGKYKTGYYSRTAGAEETTQATEVLAAVRIGSSKRPAVVVNIEYDDGRVLGLIERVGPGQWRSVWRSAFTDC
jgi:hypothetical protein